MKKMRSVVCLVFMMIAGLSPLECSRDNATEPSHGTAEATKAANGCPHHIARDQCPFCTPDLVTSQGFCDSHGVPEAHCVKCRPFLEAAFRAEGDWCAEHACPESQCKICNPPRVEKKTEVSPESAVERRSQRIPDAGCTKTRTLVRLNSVETVRTAGLEFARVESRPLVQTFSRNAELAYDAGRHARLATRAAGVVAEIRKDLGSAVTAGEVVAVVDSVELGAVKADLLQALETTELWEANAQRERGLVTRGLGTERDAQEAETRRAEARIAVAKAQQRLRNLGLRADQVESVARDHDTSSLLPLLAPSSGMVVERSAVVGEMVGPSAPFLAVADTTRLWAMVDLFVEDLVRVRTGQEVALVVDGLRGEKFSGRMTWISTQVDSKTRTLKARVELTNEGGLLRAGMFARANILAGAEEPSVVIPKEAVQWEGCCNVVFVQANDEGTEFQPKQVHLGKENAEFVEVRSGLELGEAVVTRGSYLLKTEILKGSIGAGCCDVGHLGK